MEEKKNIEIISGNGSNLNLSPVYDHLNVATPKSSTQKPKYIVIPKNIDEKKEEKKEKLEKAKKDKKNKKG